MKNKVLITCGIYILLVTFGSLLGRRGVLAHIPKGSSQPKDVSSGSPEVGKTSGPSRLPISRVGDPSLKHSLKTTAAPRRSTAIPKLPLPPTKAPAIPVPALETKGQEQVENTIPSVPPAKAVVQSQDEKDLFERAKKEEIANQKIRFYFEDATLENVVDFIQSQFHVTFLPDDAVKPMLSGGVPLQGHKITFKTNKPLTRQEAWNIFLKLLDLSGLTLVPGATKDFYRITSITNANRDPLPTFFDTEADKLPDNATKVRYIYFVKNNPLQTIQNVMTSLKSTTATVLPFPDLDALIITDKANNIRSLMKIVVEFDKTMPEAMSVLKLKRTDATKVKTLYDSLTKTEAPSGAARYMNQRSQPSSLFFPADARLIAEPRTNSLILLGPKKDLAKIENFIVKHVDTELDLPYSPLHVYHLQHTSANNVANILKQVVNFGQGTPAAQYGGVRDGQKYFKTGSINIVPEPTGNKLIIKAEEDDYEKLKEMISTLDIAQPQVAVEVLIVDVTATNAKELGIQLRNKTEGSVIDNMNFQSAQIGAQQVASGGILGNLIALATGADNPVGTTLLSIGNQSTNGIWGLFRVLKTYTDAKIVSNPFLLATNKYAASFTFGKTRRIITATVGTGSSIGDKKASLTLKVTPQINTDGVITMDITIDITEFTSEVDTEAGTTTKTITTSALVQDQEVLVLGGITKNTVATTVTKVPLLGSIPIFGNLFKGKTKEHIRSNLIIMLSPKIIQPATNRDRHANPYTEKRINEVRKELTTLSNHASSSNDPLDRMYFDSSQSLEKDYLDSFDQFMSGDIDEINTVRSKEQPEPRRGRAKQKQRLEKSSQPKRLSRKRRAK